MLDMHSCSMCINKALHKRRPIIPRKFCKSFIQTVTYSEQKEIIYWIIYNEQNELLSVTKHKCLVYIITTGKMSNYKFHTSAYTSKTKSQIGNLHTRWLLQLFKKMELQAGDEFSMCDVCLAVWISEVGNCTCSVKLDMSAPFCVII